MRKSVFLSFLFSCIWILSVKSQFQSYITLESDSVVIVVDTIQLKDKDSFHVKIEEGLDNHSYYLHFLITNPYQEKLLIVFGSEGVISPLTHQIILAPNQTERVIYSFKNVRTPGSSFSQVGKICSFTMDGSRWKYIWRNKNLSDLYYNRRVETSLMYVGKPWFIK